MVYISVLFSNLEAINPYNCYLPFIIIAIVYRLKESRLVIKKVKSININTVILFVAMCSIAISYQNISSLPKFECYLQYLIMPFLIWILSMSITYDMGRKPLNILYLLLSVAIGCGIHALLDISINRSFGRYSVVDFFTQTELAATNLGSINTFIFSLVAAVLLCATKRIVKILTVILLFISLVFGMIIGARTAFIILLLVTSTVLFSYMINEDSSAKNKLALRFITVLPLIVLLVIVMYDFNLWDVKSRLMSSNLFKYIFDQSSSSSDNYRKLLIIRGLQSIWQTPFGAQTSMVTYYHNFWLDIARVSGWVPACIMIFFNAISMKHLMAIVRNKSNECCLRYSLLGTFLGLLLNMMVEPVLDGYISLFYRFIFVSGLIEGVYCNSSKKGGI